MRLQRETGRAREPLEWVLPTLGRAPLAFLYHQQMLPLVRFDTTTSRLFYVYGVMAVPRTLDPYIKDGKLVGGTPPGTTLSAPTPGKKLVNVRRVLAGAPFTYAPVGKNASRGIIELTMPQARDLFLSPATGAEEPSDPQMVWGSLLKRYIHRRWQVKATPIGFVGFSAEF